MELLCLRKRIEYVPVEDNALASFDTKSVATWLSLRATRTSIITGHFTIHDPDIEAHRMNDRQLFQSPFFDDYRNYVRHIVLPEYVAYLGKNSHQNEDLVGRILSLLVSIAMGHMTISPSNIGFLIGDIFEHIRMIPVPNAGDCYFCAIATDVGLDAIQVRNIVADAIVRDKADYAYIVKQYVESCHHGGRLVREYENDPEGFIREFASLLRKPCNGGMDCEQCVWGGNEYDSYLAAYFDSPVVAISIERRSQEVPVDTREFGSAISEAIHAYLGVRTIRYRKDQHFIITLTYTFPERVYQMLGPENMAIAFESTYPTPIAYIYRGSHFNAVSFDAR